MVNKSCTFLTVVNVFVPRSVFCYNVTCRNVVCLNVGFVFLQATPHNNTSPLEQQEFWHLKWRIKQVYLGAAAVVVVNRRKLFMSHTLKIKLTRHPNLPPTPKFKCSISIFKMALPAKKLASFIIQNFIEGSHWLPILIVFERKQI